MNIDSSVPQKKHKDDPAGKVVLVIDDDEHLRQMLAFALEFEGFKVVTDRDGRNIIKLAAEAKPVLIVTDIMMPGGGGYEVLRTLQADVETRRVPVVVMTGASLDRSTKEMIKQEPNVVHYMEKPLNVQSFKNAVHALLNTKSKDEQIIEEQSRFPQPGGSENSMY